MRPSVIPSPDEPKSATRGHVRTYFRCCFVSVMYSMTDGRVSECLRPVVYSSLIGFTSYIVKSARLHRSFVLNPH